MKRGSSHLTHVTGQSVDCEARASSHQTSIDSFQLTCKYDNIIKHNRVVIELYIVVGE